MLLINKPKKLLLIHLSLISYFLIPLGIAVLSALGFLGFIERYVFFLAYPSAILASFFIVKLFPNLIMKISINKIPGNYNFELRKAATIALLLIILIPTIPTQIYSIINRTPNITNNEYQIFLKVGNIANTDDVVLLNNFRQYWFSAANPDLLITIYEYYVTQYIAEGRINFDYYDSNAEYSKNSRLMAKNSKMSDNDRIKYLCKLRDEKNASRILILINSTEPGLDLQFIKDYPIVFNKIFTHDDYSLFIFENDLCSSV
jgi:hypothetical protein